MSDVIVVGSIVIDLISYVITFPLIGETVIGIDFKKGFGGKGANQCVMARLLGAECKMVGKIGDDDFGRDYLNRFSNLDINTENIGIKTTLSTGAASIIVRKSDGANQIVVTPGANYELSSADVESCSQSIANSKVILCQLEIPIESTFKALEIAKAHNVFSIFNPAPIPDKGINLSEMPPVDIFCPNESEASLITGINITDVKSAKDAISTFLSDYSDKMKWPMITLGRLGVVFGDSSTKNIIHVPAPLVDAIDSTGAGDCFAGSLAYFCALHPKMSLTEKVKQSVLLASLSVQKCGTQSSFPDKDAIKFPF